MLALVWLGAASPDGGRSAESRGGHRPSVTRQLFQWVCLYGNRRLIALLLSVLIFVLLLTIGTTWEFEMETLVTETRAVQTLFNTLLGGVILFVSVVLSINTAALSQEFAPLQVKQTQIEDSIEFQIELEELTQSGVSPAGLGSFLSFVLHAVREETETLKRKAGTIESEETRRALLAFIDDIEAELFLIEERLRADNQRVSTILLAGLDYDYARHINTARRIEAQYGTDLRGSELEPLSHLIEILTFFASGREYFTTLYFKRELRNLSSNLLVLSLPVIVFTSYVLLAIDSGLFPTVTVLEIQPRLLYVSLAFVIALSPYVLLSSYMLRMVTVSKHSLESTGFTLDEEEPHPTLDE